MIRWCSYCQGFLGEIAPFDDPTFTHGLCEPCFARLERDEPLIEETAPVRGLMQQILANATQGDDAACAALIADARTLGLATESLLVGLLQPALYQAGLDWQETRMSVASEHRFTSWCERVFHMLEPTPRAPLPVDILLLQAPGNAHTLGVRFAGRVLTERGFHVETVSTGVPFEEIVSMARALRPRFIAQSCTMTSHVSTAVALAGRLRTRIEPELRCRYVLGGFAFRLGGGGAPPAIPDVEVALDLNFFKS